MAKNEGLYKFDLSQEGFLEAAGILTGASNEIKTLLPDEAVHLFAAVATAGSSGLPTTKIPKELKNSFKEASLALELAQLIEQAYDPKTQKSYLRLTWKGLEAIEAARPKTTQFSTSRRMAMLGRK